MVRAAQRSGLRSVLPGRDTPWTLAVVLAVACGYLGLRVFSSSEAAVLHWASTNVVNLRDHPVSALIASAVVSQDGSPRELLLFALSAALLERRVGMLRAVVVPVLGHVIASLVTEGEVRQAIWAGSSPRAEAWQLDVGISYLAFTAAAAALACLRPRLRVAGLVLLVGWTLSPLLQAPDMTAYGHALSVGVGVVCWPWLHPRPSGAYSAAAAAPTRRLVVHLPRAVAVSGLAAITVIGVLALGLTGPTLPDRAALLSAAAPHSVGQSGPLATRIGPRAVSGSTSTPRWVTRTRPARRSPAITDRASSRIARHSRPPTTRATSLGQMVASGER